MTFQLNKHLKIPILCGKKIIKKCNETAVELYEEHKVELRFVSEGVFFLICKM